MADSNIVELKPKKSVIPKLRNEGEDNSFPLAPLESPELTPPPLAGLSLIARPSNPNPLDPNGIDVLRELPYMQRAYERTNLGHNFGGTQEAGYSIVGNGNNRSSTVFAPEKQMFIPAPKGATRAIVHTHPVNANPLPSGTDEDNAVRFQVPDYVYATSQGHQMLNVANPNGKVSQYDVDKWNVPLSGFAGIKNKSR